MLMGDFNVMKIISKEDIDAVESIYTNFTPTPFTLENYGNLIVQ